MPNLFSTIVLVEYILCLLKVLLLHSLPQPISQEQYNYYVAELAFYCSLMFSQFIDVKRKVSRQQLSCHYSPASW